MKEYIEGMWESTIEYLYVDTTDYTQINPFSYQLVPVSKENATMIQNMTDAKQRGLIIRVFSSRFEKRRELEQFLGATENILDKYEGLKEFIPWLTEHGKWDELEAWLERQKVR